MTSRRATEYPVATEREKENQGMKTTGDAWGNQVNYTDSLKRKYSGGSYVLMSTVCAQGKHSAGKHPTGTWHSQWKIVEKPGGRRREG